MILLTILLLMAIILAVLVVLGIATVGSIGIVVFGDVIVCIFFLIWLIRKIINK